VNIKQLENTLLKMNVSSSYYTINGSLKTDTYVLNEVHGKWEYFYFDEKGNRQNYKVFEKEEEACNLFLSIIKNEISYPTSIFHR
jgi:hypothetical protein